MRINVFFILIILTGISIGVIWVHERTIEFPSDKDYVQAIVGEAADQTEDTMICVAHALRNRGNLHGVYGFDAIHVKTEGRNIWRKAWIAWEISKKEPDMVNDARNFQTEEELEENNPDVDIKAQCGDFYFF